MAVAIVALLDDLARFILDLFKQLPDVLKLLMFVILLVVLVGLAIWKYVAWRNLKNLRREIKAVRQERDQLLRRIESLDQIDDHIWKRPDAQGANRFVDRGRRSTRFLAICNLKGGVGKTTLTANLAACLALKGKRALVVDLDFQGTVSNFLVQKEMLTEYRHNGWTT